MKLLGRLVGAIYERDVAGCRNIVRFQTMLVMFDSVHTQKLILNWLMVK